MARVVVALYENFDNVRQAIQNLVDSGFETDTISLVAYDDQHAYRKMLWRQATGEEEARPGGRQADERGGENGAGLGALIGSVGGMLAGLLALALPGVGPVVAAGPLITVLAGAGIGATAGGMLGALVDNGLPDEHAQAFAEGVRRGETLLMVNTTDDRARQAVEIMNHYGPVDLENRLPLAGSNGHTRAESAALESLPAGEATAFDTERFRSLYAEYEPLFQQHYAATFSQDGQEYRQVRPAYSLGLELAVQEQNRGLEWRELEPQARRSWERRYGDSPWEAYRAAVRQGWSVAGGRE